MISKKELGILYKISRPTLNKRLDTLGFERGKRLFTPLEIQNIFSIWGNPV